MSEQSISKRCPKCKQFKPISEFHKDKRGKDGLQGYCKTCGKIAHRKYQKTEKGKLAYRKANSKYKKTDKGKANQKRYFLRHPNQVKAQHTVNHAIEDGNLPRPNTQLCHYCPKPAQQYHHWSYLPEHWLDVVPVCIKCHNSIHNKIYSSSTKNLK